MGALDLNYGKDKYTKNIQKSMIILLKIQISG